MKRILAAITLLAAALPINAQKPALDHTVYDDWKSISTLKIQDAGDWATYTVSPQQGDAVLHFYNVRTGKDYQVERGSNALISRDATKAVFKIAPRYQQTRQARIKKTKPEKMPKDTLGVIDLATGRVTTYSDIREFKSSDALYNYVAYKKTGKNNDTLYVLNIRSGVTDTLAHVEAYRFPDQAEKIAYITKPGKKDSTTVRGVYLYEPAARNISEVMTGDKKSVFTGLNFSRKGDKLVFFANLDTVKDAAKRLDMYITEGKTSRMLLSHEAPAFPKGWKFGEKAGVAFFDNYMTFGIMPTPREKDTTLVDFEQARLDVWVWNEDYIQPIQKHNLQRDLARTYLSKINYDGTGFVQIADEEIPSIRIDESNVQDCILETCDKPYRIRRQWNYDPCSDIYLISLKDGSRRLIKEGATYSDYSVSPDGAYYVAYDAQERNWYLYSLQSGEWKELTSSLGVAFYDEEDDHPMMPSAYGRAYWSEDSRYFFIRDRFDYWRFDATGMTAPECFTDGKGRETNTSYSIVFPVNRTLETPSQRRQIKKSEPVYFTTFNHTTKKTGFARKDVTRKGATVEKLVEGPYTYSNMAVALGKKPVIMYTRGCFEDGNDLWLTRDNFKSQIRQSDINPQKKNYNWGTVELVSWKAADGTDAEGLLFKPENFNPQKKYPVIIYFYERNSETLFAPRSPAPSASTVNIPYFVSNEYIVFVPDIRYKDGHPGKSCLNYIMPGCDMLCEYPWIDGDNMAIQGQSWGGYQVAYMITQTGRFKAAGAGAPVSNMTSAYGGIRWESGVARTAQYEKGQSRIGKDLWEGFDLYVENSPLFYVPNVTTPVLIMHNDQDGAVPWWQGIEFFNALRRCGKQAWMLQYNDEAHNLKERRNRKDLSIRLEQFFGHFLKGEPMPVWMSKGVPATLKGIDYGFEKDEFPTDNQ
ncbi:MAG: S9 family peptidase [Bacteroidales bacterium]|nr:S9 family peptidase [Candidatus Cacconaster equi]